MSRNHRRAAGRQVLDSMAATVSQCRALVVVTPPQFKPEPTHTPQQAGAACVYMLLMRIATGESDVVDALALVELFGYRADVLADMGVPHACETFSDTMTGKRRA